MKLSEFDYSLPKELIAQTPIYPRDSSRLLVLDKNTWEIEDKNFFDIVDYLWDNDVLVLNKTKVLKARLKWEFFSSNWDSKKDCEIFLHKQISLNTWDCLVYPWKKLKIWIKVYFNGLIWVIKDITKDGRIVEFDKWWNEFFEIIEKI